MTKSDVKVKTNFLKTFYIFTAIFLIGSYAVFYILYEDVSMKVKWEVTEPVNKLVSENDIEIERGGEAENSNFNFNFSASVEVEGRGENESESNDNDPEKGQEEIKDQGMACHLPKLNPYDDSIKEFVKKPDPVNCSDVPRFPPLFTTDLKSTLLVVNEPANYGLSNCCYQSFVRKPESEYNVILNSTCVPIFKTQTEIPEDIEFIQISCKNKTANETWQIVDIFGFVHLKKSVEERIAKLEKGADFEQDKKGRRTVNVVAFGIDAVSHMNFLRNFPLTYNYIKTNLSALGLNGITKVGDNTFPNLVPVLTGLYSQELRTNTSCWKTDAETFDACPFIWKDYSAQGYRTALAEDAVWMGVFNYGHNKGFKNEPTDYYLKTMTYRQEDIIGHHGEGRNAKICYGTKLSFQVLLEYLQQMAITMGKTKRYFQFIWAGALTHDYLADGNLADQILMETLKFLKDQGYLEDTIFILMSDHGIRWGKIVETLQGKLEERMPFAYFLIPEWFRDKYRTAVSNLRGNENKLSTPFDFHETFKDLLFLENLEEDKIRERHLNLNLNPILKMKNERENLNDSSSSSGRMPRGISLFLSIPPERTCSDASILDQWCVCRKIQPVTTLENNTLVEEAARSVVFYINGMFLKYPQCKILYLKEVVNAQVLQSDNLGNVDQSSNITDAFDESLSKQQVTFSLTFRVEPSNATFTASTTRHTNGSWEVMKEISRINLFGQQSRCVTVYNLKKFCFCG